MTSMVRKVAALLLLTLLCGSPLHAGDWARNMFETTSHDFGSLARDAKAEFHFVLKNIYVEDVHISSARASLRTPPAHPPPPRQRGGGPPPPGPAGPRGGWCGWTSTCRPAISTTA